jgi:hypothetical protein
VDAIKFGDEGEASPKLLTMEVVLSVYVSNTNPGWHHSICQSILTLMSSDCFTNIHLRDFKIVDNSLLDQVSRGTVGAEDELESSL